MIDEVLFSEFILSRQDLKKPMSDRAKKMMLNKLIRLDSEGYCPNLLMERSIINGWQDVFTHESCLKLQPKAVGFIARVTDTSWADTLPENVRRLK
jgi:hypothetical protein